jgi:hydrogenase-4 membrane subunit HyfE
MSLKPILGIMLALFGPLVVWLIFAHALPVHLRNGLAMLALPLSFVVGFGGLWLILSRLKSWNDKYLLLAVACYALALIAATPFFSLLAVCSTGDCL